MPIRSDIIDRVLVLTVDNPPVNALSQVERAGLSEAIAAAGGQDVAAVVITGAKSFIAGADIKEFGKPGVPPMLPEVVNAIEACPKLVVAAIEGQALGGGLEIALACHFRLAQAEAKLGLPEVNLGIIPGSGGTQRLPRLIGALNAAIMISDGKSVTASEALKLGLLDQVVNGHVLDAAIRFAREHAGADLAERRLSTRTLRLSGDEAENLAGLRQAVLAKSRGAKAAVVAIDLVAKAAGPFEEGSAAERAAFTELRVSPEAAALRHVFFAEREAAKSPVADAVPREIKQVGIIGAGTMGAGIAISVIEAGLSVTLIERADDALAAGLGRITKHFQTQVSRGRIDVATAERRIAAVHGSTDYAALASADLIIEAAFESMAVKQDIFTRIDAVAKPGAILASNTSYLDLDAIAAVTGRPQDVVGLHYFSPANIMKLLEIVRGAATAPDVLASALAFAKKTGKIAVISGVCAGFIGNRMLRAYGREAGLLLLEGATPQQVDKALTGFGLAMGPFEVADLAGIDIGFKARQEAEPGSFEPAASLVHDGLYAAGQLGQKTGAGFYLYDPQTRAKTPNPLADDLIAKARMELQITPRAIDDQEIIERCLYALANEGLQIVDEGIAARTGDTDVVYVNGYGFPRHRGGPVFYASQVGFDQVRAAIARFQQGRFGHWWKPAAGLGQSVAD